MHRRWKKRLIAWDGTVCSGVLPQTRKQANIPHQNSSQQNVNKKTSKKKNEQTSETSSAYNREKMKARTKNAVNRTLTSHNKTRMWNAVAQERVPCCRDRTFEANRDTTCLQHIDSNHSQCSKLGQIMYR